MDWTSQSSSEGGYSSSGGSSEEGIGSARDVPEPDATGKIGGGAMLVRAGMAMDGVDEKLVIIVDTSSLNIVTQCEIMATCMNTHKYSAPSWSVSSSTRSSW